MLRIRGCLIRPVQPTTGACLTHSAASCRTARDSAAATHAVTHAVVAGNEADADPDRARVRAAEVRAKEVEAVAAALSAVSNDESMVLEQVRAVR